MYIFHITLLCLLFSSSVFACILRYQTEFDIPLSSPIKISTNDHSLIVKSDSYIYQLDESNALTLLTELGNSVSPSHHTHQFGSSHLNSQFSKFINRYQASSFVASTHDENTIYLITYDNSKNKLIEIDKAVLNEFDFDNAKQNIKFFEYDILTPSNEGVSAIISDITMNKLNNTLYVSLFVIDKKEQFQQYINYISPIHLEFLKVGHDIAMYFDAQLIQKENKNQKIESIAVIPKFRDVTDLYLSMIDNKGSKRILKYQLLD
ncbi:hypothetical protein [Photobacterium leiognathi]|uniref:hypothetical protein n=1 Tax=Photobacterium leiognathi TaxID=553611 RepID=UPI00298143EA|nr:hypothetical protein [Photobacterium leiognathi]